MRHLIGIFLLIPLFIGCTNSNHGESYLNKQPALQLENFFNGEIKAWGIVQDRSGVVVTRFSADIEGSWNGKDGILDELFTYHDTGMQQTRVWQIEKIADGKYKGSADDIIGEAAGETFGNAVFWTYDMNIPFKGSKYKVRFDDWIWAMDENVVVNRSYLRKFGIKVAEVTIFMQKQLPTRSFQH